jgi:hypothetical protein
LILAVLWNSEGRDDASCLLGLEGLAAERVVLTGLGVRIVQQLYRFGKPEAVRTCTVLVGGRVARHLSHGIMLARVFGLAE